jgi:hypothetical protein
LGIGTNIDLLKIGFVVVISTFITYLLNLPTMKELNQQPLLFYLSPTCICILLGLGKDELNLVKILSAILIFVGVHL